VTGTGGGSDLFLGIDLGTSGARACVVDAAGEARGFAAVPMDTPVRDGRSREQSPTVWWDALLRVLERLRAQVALDPVAALAVDATSGTVLLCDLEGSPLTPALMYDDTRAQASAERIRELAPPTSGAHGAASALAKLLHLTSHFPLPPQARAVHQADWILGRLTGHWGISDENNALKLGYDPLPRRWPGWLAGLGVDPGLLPTVVPPATPIGPLLPRAADALGLPRGAMVVSGTTDSIAGFIATGARDVGEAVTALGSTLVLKVISPGPVFAPEYGVYSHRLGDRWLAGGASNSGGAVLRAHFAQAELDAMTPRLRPDEPTGLDYHPLLRPGERFPLADPSLAPRLTPRPDDDRTFFQGLLEGIAAIEQRGYARLADLGAPYPSRVRTTGGGARNPAWGRIRARLLGVPLVAPRHSEAAFGSALLARAGALGAGLPGSIAGRNGRP
jgi:sugar (pentulose or hexulose) kinase